MKKNNFFWGTTLFLLVVCNVSIYAAGELETGTSTPQSANDTIERPYTPPTISQPKANASTSRNTGPLYTGNGGKGIVIAVPTPSMRNGTASDNWVPQLFQDLLTGDLARYSAMTVVDRSNQNMVIAEQKLSESDFFSDDAFISIGNMTNAQYVVAGNILKTSGRYTVTFRINNIETNEIQASFNKQYALPDIENGLAAKEAVKELLAGMGIALTAAGEQELLAPPSTQIKATAQLARGMAAERSDNLVEALAYFTQAVDADPSMKEAAFHIQNFAGEIPTSSIRERANLALAQKDKWNKIFKDLDGYTEKNLLIVVYDFSSITDKFDAGSKTVQLTITPGIKFIPNGTVIAVWKAIVDNWNRVSKLDENKSWVSEVKTLGLSSFGRSYAVTTELYDDYGDIIGSSFVRDPGVYPKSYVLFARDIHLFSEFRPMAQIKYFNNTKFEPVRFSRIKLDDITDNLSVKIGTIKSDPSPRASEVSFFRNQNASALVLSVPEWELWLAEQTGAIK